MHAGMNERMKRVLDPWKLELQVIVIHLTSVLGIGVRSIGRTSTLPPELSLEPRTKL